MAGALTGGLPDSVEVSGKPLRISTDWRTWVDIWRIADNPSAEASDRVIGVLALAYPNDGASPTPFEEAMQSPVEAVTAAIGFLERKRPGMEQRPQTARERRLSRKRLLDWDYDGERIAADFQREYGIDLTDEATSMHWWRFMALLGGLGDGSQTMRAISTRAADLDDKRLGKEERRALRERKQAYMLPARTREEAAANRTIRGE